MKHVRTLLLAILPGLLQAPAWSHGGEDHGSPAAVEQTSADRPSRLPDGRVFLPKLSQRQLALRTQPVSISSQPRSIELNGHVVGNPNASGRVQASQPGRISAGPQGLPLPGSPVRKGQLLAYLQPSASSQERANQQAEQADLANRLALAGQQWQRLQALADTVPRKEIDAASAEHRALQQRLAALRRGGQRETLLAPASGRIASASVVNGQVVEAKEILFEIVDPQQLLIEALVYDPAQAAALQDASLAGSATPLRLLGGPLAMRDGALPLLFQPAAGRFAEPLALGQVVKVLARSQQRQSGAVLPASAVVLNPANQPIVWLHERAELFRPLPVQVSPLDGQQVLVSGLSAGQRIVVSAANLLNQIR